jgi:hypothetical protein
MTEIQFSFRPPLACRPRLLDREELEEETRKVDKSDVVALGHLRSLHPDVFQDGREECFVHGHVSIYFRWKPSIRSRLNDVSRKEKAVCRSMSNALGLRRAEGANSLWARGHQTGDREATRKGLTFKRALFAVFLFERSMTSSMDPAMACCVCRTYLRSL